MSLYIARYAGFCCTTIIRSIKSTREKSEVYTVDSSLIKKTAICLANLLIYFWGSSFLRYCGIAFHLPVWRAQTRCCLTRVIDRSCLRAGFPDRSFCLASKGRRHISTHTYANVITIMAPGLPFRLSNDVVYPTQYEPKYGLQWSFLQS